MTSAQAYQSKNVADILRGGKAVMSQIALGYHHVATSDIELDQRTLLAIWWEEAVGEDAVIARAVEAQGLSFMELVA